MKGFNNKEHKPFPTYQEIFKSITDQQIFQSYIPNITFNTSMSSPLGEPDDKPSFSVFWSDRYNKFLFKEHRYGWSGDCFDFVQKLYGYETLTEALMQVCIDFGLTQYHINPNLKKGVLKVIKKVKPINKFNYKVSIDFTIRKWNDDDIEYWKSYGISKDWLKNSGIYPIKYYFINGVVCIADKYAYVYVEEKDGLRTYKIYQPFNKNKKWISNNNRSVWELWSVLPPTHEILVITKSRKDALSIMSTLGIPSVALQAEGTIPKDNVVEELKERFHNIYLLYDNDFDKSKNYGRDYGSKLCESFGITQIELPEKYGEKDYSDLVKQLGVKKASEILINIIKNRKK